MALDASLFTLTLQRRANEVTALDLIPFKAAATIASTSKQSEPLYSFIRAKSSAYNVQLQDYLTSMPLASIEAPSSADKIRQIKIYNPDDAVILEKKTMTFRQEWHWTWQGQEYLVRKDGRSYIVEALRKPDPEIDIARYTARSKTRPSFLQMLDYNIQRLELEDRKGLEMLILMSICTLLDAEYDEKYKDGPSGNVYLSGYTPTLSTPSTYNMASSALAPSDLKDVKAEPNELHIDMYTPNEVFTQKAITLLRQDEGGEGLHLIILKATNAQITPKAVQIAADIKARWYRLEPVAKGRTLDPLPGSQTEIAEELYQYVRDPSLQQSQASSSTSSSSTMQHNQSNGQVSSISQRPRIKLDPPTLKENLSASQTRPLDSSPSKVQKTSFLPPPNQLDIYLSKEKLDEFELTANASLGNTKSHFSLQQRPNSTPSIPPKKHPYEELTHETKGRKILGKLGLRKGQVNS